MKWNEAECLAFLASRTPDWQGKLAYKPPKQGGTFGLQQPSFKERYFKLVGNLLFCLRSDSSEVLSLLVLETGTVQKEDKDLNLFSIEFNTDDSVGEKHVFAADSKRGVLQWLEALRSASYEKKRQELILLQIKLRSMTGRDPLAGTAFTCSSVYNFRGRVEEDSSSGLTSDDGRSPPGRRRPGSCCRAARKNGGGPPVKSNFTSHLGIQVWEREDDEEEGAGHVCDESCNSVAQLTPSFKSHLADTADLIQF